mmetsp:Transcript_10343/g.39139  ORF Transcript_10343/g.39139 Transcript_10343/m.39139 type:complete len:554 (-) Transcript_10343:127-1788(-)
MSSSTQLFEPRERYEELGVGLSGQAELSGGFDVHSDDATRKTDTTKSDLHRSFDVAEDLNGAGTSLEQREVRDGDAGNRGRSYNGHASVGTLQSAGPMSSAENLERFGLPARHGETLSMSNGQNGSLESTSTTTDLQPFNAREIKRERDPQDSSGSRLVRSERSAEARQVDLLVEQLRRAHTEKQLLLEEVVRMREMQRQSRSGPQTRGFVSSKECACRLMRSLTMHFGSRAIERAFRRWASRTLDLRGLPMRQRSQEAFDGDMDTLTHSASFEYSHAADSSASFDVVHLGPSTSRESRGRRRHRRRSKSRSSKKPSSARGRARGSVSADTAGRRASTPTLDLLYGRGFADIQADRAEHLEESQRVVMDRKIKSPQRPAWGAGNGDGRGPQGGTLYSALRIDGARSSSRSMSRRRARERKRAAASDGDGRWKSQTQPVMQSPGTKPTRKEATSAGTPSRRYLSPTFKSLSRHHGDDMTAGEVFSSFTFRGGRASISGMIQGDRPRRRSVPRSARGTQVGQTLRSSEAESILSDAAGHVSNLYSMRNASSVMNS